MQPVCTEVMNLLKKGAIEIVPPAQCQSGFYSHYFLVPKKDGGLRPILDLRLLNYALMKRSFRMITLKQILSQICPGDWFMSLDMKDAYFHIQVAPHYRQLLRFAFEGVAYQYKVLPFGLSLGPHTFTRCTDAALSPLRQMGIHILNYLDDWLILAFQRMLGLMAAASPVLRLGLLHMRPIQFWLKQKDPSAAWRHGRYHLTVTWACVSALARW